MTEIIVYAAFYLYIGFMFAGGYTDFQGGLERLIAIAIVYPLILLRWGVVASIWLVKHSGGIARGAVHEVVKEVRR
jgi:hypothetical protein